MPITITSTGIEEYLVNAVRIVMGGKYFMRIGSAGALVELDIGTVIPIAAVREDGVQVYVYENYPAVSDFELTGFILDTAKN